MEDSTRPHPHDGRKGAALSTRRLSLALMIVPACGLGQRSQSPFLAIRCWRSLGNTENHQRGGKC